MRMMMMKFTMHYVWTISKYIQGLVVPSTSWIDAQLLVQNVPNLQFFLRLAEVSFIRVHVALEVFSLKNLKELSMPVDLNVSRNAHLLATLTYGSDQITTLDLRASLISSSALINMPSKNVKELLIDHWKCLRIFQERNYSNIIRGWRHSLEVVSLINVNFRNPIRCRLKVLIDRREGPLIIKDFNLDSCYVKAEDLTRFSSNNRDQFNQST